MKIRLSVIAYAAVVATMFGMQGIGSFAESQHTIAKESLTTNGQTVTARALDDRTVVYQPFMTRTTISMERGKLAVLQTTAAHRGILVKHREPTATEAAIWQKYFGA